MKYAYWEFNSLLDGSDVLEEHGERGQEQDEYFYPKVINMNGWEPYKWMVMLVVDINASEQQARDAADKALRNTIEYEKKRARFF